MKLALTIIVLSGCGIDLAPTSEWVPADEIAGLLAPSVGGNRSAVSPAGDTIRVVTYNIRDGGVDPLVLAEAMRADPVLSLADIVLLQEELALPDEDSPRAALLARALDMGWFYAPARPEQTGTLGNAILSRFPMDNLEVMKLPIASRKRQRTAISASVHIGEVTLHVVTTHLDTTLNIADRILQLRPAVLDMTDMALVGGDFNTNPYLWEEGAVPAIPQSVVVDTDQAILLDDYMGGLGFENPTAQLGATETRYGIESRLDAVYAHNVTVVDRGIQRTIELSDHWPVWIDIKIQP